MLSQWLIKHGYPVTDSSEDEEIEEHTGFKPGDVVFDKFRKRTGTCTITYLRLVDPHELQPGAWRNTNIVYRDKENNAFPDQLQIVHQASKDGSVPIEPTAESYEKPRTATRTRTPRQAKGPATTDHRGHTWPASQYHTVRGQDPHARIKAHFKTITGLSTRKTVRRARRKHSSTKE